MLHMPMFWRRLGVLLGTLLVVVAGVAGAAAPAGAVSSTVVISQVYGGGGNAGAPYRNDFVELFNRGATTVTLDGWSIQYASATGTGTFASNPITPLSGSLAPGQYYLVQMASGGATGALLPTPDATGTVPIASTAGKIVLVTTTVGLSCNGGSVPCTPEHLALMVDLIGWGTANYFEGAVGPATSNALAALRGTNGCTETDNNAADFTAQSPNPRTTSSPLFVNAPSAAISAPVADEVLTGSSTTFTGTASDPDNALASVEVAIQRSSGDPYWTGSAWSADETWLTVTGTTAWTYDWTFDVAPQDGSPSYTITARATNTVGNTGTAVVPGVVIDNAAPRDLALLIDGDATYAASRDVELTVAATGASEMRFSNDGTDWSDWQSYAESADWTLADGDGEKTVFMECRDAVGNAAQTSDTITLDTAAPSDLTLLIDGDAAYTASRDVELTVAATGASEMRFSNDESDWSDWQSYAESKAWTLAAGDGEKTVYGEFRDAAGNSAQTSDTITLDTASPSGVLVIAGGIEAVNRRSVTLSCTVTDATEMRFSNDGTSWSSWQAYSSSKGWKLATGDGEKNVDAQFRGLSGGELAISSSIVLDTRRPTPWGTKAVAVRRGATASLPFTIYDRLPSSGKATVVVTIKTLAGKTAKVVTLRNQPVRQSLTCGFVCTLAKGTYRFSVHVTDLAGNAQTKGAVNTLTVR